MPLRIRALSGQSMHDGKHIKLQAFAVAICSSHDRRLQGLFTSSQRPSQPPPLKACARSAKGLFNSVNQHLKDHSYLQVFVMPAL